MTKILVQVFTTMVCATLALTLIAGILTYGPVLEMATLPVISQTSITKITRMSPNDVVIYGEFNKIRDNCIPERTTGYLTNDRNTFTDLVQLLWPNTSGKYNVRPLGMQSFGPLLVSGDRANSGRILVVYTYHDCHSLWLSKTKILEVKLP